MRIIISLIVFLLTMAGLRAADRINFFHIGLEQGLSQSTVIDILQDRRENMWIATHNGLNRYDGGTHRCQCRGTHKLTDDNGVSHIVYLLKKAAENHRHCKNRQRFQRRICDQIFIFRHDLFSSELCFSQFFKFALAKYTTLFPY